MPSVKQGVGREHFDGNVTAERKLLGLVNNTHAAAANLTQDLVVSELLQRRRDCRALCLTSSNLRIIL